MTDRWRGYRVSLDGREGGSFGRIDPPGGKDGKAAANPFSWPEHWKKGDWNAVRVRMQGDRARGHHLAERRSRSSSGATRGPAARGRQRRLGAWRRSSCPADRRRFRNVSVKQLPHSGDE
jgi:hypothetical protein